MRRTGLAGVVVVVAGIAGQVVAQDRPLSADFAEVYRVGGVNAPDWAFFTGRSPTGFDAAGNLHVLDMQYPQVVIIDPRGRLVRTVGRGGEAAGEFDAAADIFVWRDGRFVVMDRGQNAYQVFGPEGELEHYVSRGGGTGLFTSFSNERARMRPDPAGGALIAQGMPSFMGDVLSGVFEQMAELTGQSVETPEPGVDDRGLERLDLTGDVVSATPILRTWRVPRLEAQEELSIEDLADPSTLAGIMNLVRYFEPFMSWDVLPDGTLAYSDSTAYAIKLAQPSGQVIGVLRRPIQAEVVTDRIRQATIDNELRELEEGMASAESETAALAGIFAETIDDQRRLVEERGFYPEIQVVRGVEATWGGALWIQRRGEDPWDDSGPIDVFGANREYVGTFAEGETEMPAAFGPGGLVVFWEFDELDVPTIVVKRLPEEVR
ncbi:MAG: hypothetical protein OXL34_18330 [Gemmatimonadota bacterium]|nr:hypothetical protein [Gemmatimonadota bacterium]